MATDLQRSPLDRARELLGCDEEVPLFALLDQLRAARNESHPDKFLDESVKEEAEEKFKELQLLLQEIERLADLDRLNRKPSELTLYRPLYDALTLHRELDAAKLEARSLRAELQKEREDRAVDQEQLRNLEALLSKKDDEQLASEIKHLQKIYRPSARGFASVGLAVLFAGIVGTATQVERVSSILEKYSPFDGVYIRTGVFILLLVLLLGVGRKLLESGYIERRSEEICSPRLAEDFLATLSEGTDPSSPVREFSEVQAFRFIAGKTTWWRRLSVLVGFSIFREQTSNRLKDIFIHTLLNKRLIEFSRAERMQRHFRIANTASTDFWYEQYRKERDKNETLGQSIPF